MIKGIDISKDVRPCGVCGTPTHRLVGGKPMCSACAEAAEQAEAEAKPQTEVPTPPSPESAGTKPEASKTPDKGFGDYLCPKCKVTHRAGSKVHKRHLKLL